MARSFLSYPAAVRRDIISSRGHIGRHSGDALVDASMVATPADGVVICGPDDRHYSVATLGTRRLAGPLVEVHGWVVICRCGWHSRSATREGAEMLAEHHRRLGGRHEPVINEQ